MSMKTMGGPHFAHKIVHAALGRTHPHASASGLSLALPDLAGTSVGLRVSEEDARRHVSWLQDRLGSLGLGNPHEYARLLDGQDEAGRNEREQLSRQLTTGETYFFRDPGQFDLLARQILPELLAERAGTRRLKLWSAGCASGEEAYSLAILLGELLPDDGVWDIRILGTDINSDALKRARAGLYSDWSFRALDEMRKAAHFRAEGRHWRISERLRARVRFEQVDLVRDVLPHSALGLEQVDLILCRNVFIYMTAETTARVSGKLSAVLAEGGYLLTGHGELLGHHPPGLHPRIYAQSVVLQKSAMATVVPVWPDLPPPQVMAPRQARSAASGKFVIRPAPGSRASKGVAQVSPSERGQRLLQEAWRLADQGQVRQAESTCRLAIEATPLDPWPYYLLAQLAQERGDAEAARVQLDKVLYLDPHCIAAYLELATLQDSTRPSNRGRALLETARRLLAALPAGALVAPYEHSTATDVLAFVERLLSEEGRLSDAAPESAFTAS